jgi:hypothetical protein
MAKDDFDLLSQLGENKKVEALKAKIEKKKSIDILSKLDEIESKIETAANDNKSQEEIVGGIIDSNFETLNNDVKESEQDLQELMLHLRSMLDNAGGEFSKLQELNDDELKLVEKAKAELSDAESALRRAEGMSNAWNILFGYKNSKVKNTKAEIQKEISELKTAEADANKSYRDRLRNADMEDSLQRIISQVQGMVGIIEVMVEDTDVQIQALKNRKELAFGTKEKAAEVMKARKADLETLEDTLKREELALSEFQNNSPEYTAQEKKIADLREQRAELKGKYNIALGIFQSKERFVEQIVVHLEAQTVTKNNLKQLIGQLKSDTEERVTTYESGLQLIQAASAQEAASIYEDAGAKTDQKITEIAAKVLVGSEKDRIERIKKHPNRMTELHGVLVGLAEATAKFKAEDRKLMKEHADKFGIDVSETFSFNHEGNDSPSGNDSAPAPSSKKSDSVDGLMD